MTYTKYYQRTRDGRLLSNHGINEKQFDAMLADQDGRCAICRKDISGTEANKDNRIAPAAKVDHDHETGVVRGLLCSTCNSGLGMFKDSIRNLASAIVYLEANGKTFNED